MLSGVAKIQRHASSHCETAMPEISEKLKKLMKISPVVLVGQTLMVTLLVPLKNNENYRINKFIISHFLHLIFCIASSYLPLLSQTTVVAKHSVTTDLVSVLILRHKISRSSTQYYLKPNFNESREELKQ